MSQKLQTIIDQQHGKSVVLAVFIEIVKYPLRRSALQKRVIDRLRPPSSPLALPRDPPNLQDLADTP